MALARFVNNERKCCPFWSFGLDVEPNHGNLCLRLTGPADAKLLLKGLLSQTQAAVLARINVGGDATLAGVVAQSLPGFASISVIR